MDTSVQGSPKSENRTIGPVLGSQKYLEEPDRTEPYHPYPIPLRMQKTQYNHQHQEGSQ